MKHLRTLDDLTAAELRNILTLATRIKKNQNLYRKTLSGKSVALLFEKPSTRTRMSFEIGVAELGGTPVVLDWQSTQLGRAAVKDEVRCIARYADAIGARVRSQKTIEEMAQYAGVPMINLLSDKEHPCQAIGDMMTVQERFSNLKKVHLAFVGDGNNVCNSLIAAAMKLGMRMTVSCPKGYEPDTALLRLAKKKGSVRIERDPAKACRHADVVYTDTWVSMGQERQRKARLSAFRQYKITRGLLGGAFFMHCLPAFRGEEVADDVIDSAKSIVFDQAENRLYAQKALLVKLLGSRRERGK